MTLCDCRHRCKYPGLDDNGRPCIKTRDQAAIACGYELANTTNICPKRRRLQEDQANA